MASPRPPSLCFAFWTLAACWLLSARVASGQQQERTLFDRIKNPDMTLKAEGYEKTFTPASSSILKAAPVKAFAFSRAATPRAGDSPFRTRNFAGSGDGYRTAAYETKPSALAGRGAPQADRTYATAAVAVREDPASGKSALVRTDSSSGKAFVPHGKRQDEIDEIRRQKDLTPDQVREILNKNK